MTVPRRRWSFSLRLMSVVVIYELTGLLFVGTGGFNDVYFLLGFDWNDRGAANVIHTSICWVVVELPLLVGVGCWLLRRNRTSDDSPAAQADRP